MGDGKDKFRNVITRYSPYNWDTILGWGLQFFIEEIEAEEVSFTRHKNGFSFDIKTDDGNVDKAQEFWEEHVKEKL